MEIKVLGAAGEVGRSAFQVNCDGTNFLLDYGVMFGSPRGSPPTYPLHVSREILILLYLHMHILITLDVFLHCLLVVIVMSMQLLQLLNLASF